MILTSGMNSQEGHYRQSQVDDAGCRLFLLPFYFVSLSRTNTAISTVFQLGDLRVTLPRIPGSNRLSSAKDGETPFEGSLFTKNRQKCYSSGSSYLVRG
jgi:hypothetical protein